MAEIELVYLHASVSTVVSAIFPPNNAELAAWNTSAKRHGQNHLLAVHHRALLEPNLSVFILFLMIKFY